MQQNGYVADSAAAIAQYFEKPRFQRNRKRWVKLWLKFLATGETSTASRSAPNS